ncbi:hypothetical protein MHB43_31810 [Paenibacillus sp. FSL H8-0317]|uniref:hypothetical protein n=2 Tax=unclassified Paenibacillus TaxID=185978 RepID=UPI0032541EF3
MDCFQINEVQLDRAVRLPVMKQTDGQQVPDVVNAYKLMLWNMHDITSKFKAYNMVQWTKYIDHWSNTYGRRFTTNYSRGDILMVDLGAMNYGYEFSYTHPVIVVYETLDMVFVVPGSSKKFGIHQQGVVDATSANDGFDRDTGLLLYNMRWIHKNRIKHATGRQTSQRILKKIEEFNLRINHEYHQEVQRRAESNKKLRTKVYDLNQEIRQLQNSINQNEHKLIQSETKIQTQERIIEKYRKNLGKIDILLIYLKNNKLATRPKNSLIY